MKKNFVNLAFILTLAFLLPSCYSLTYSVGEGPQSGIEVKEKNHFFIYGLATGKTSDPTAMAGDATDYEVSISHTFVDGLISAVTFGIYNPTTTKITK
ncbi:Bor protein [Aquiflexum balticum DSM 16537]|uniref:Bor protein n=1 Tax=Aquiflexum balticum DSM 16537 TaxID=758820 RepID=A0A1W2H378_9BACT|nr:Bor family protein [Aquiflexum balticum]SMD43397.1 Bor protein [Aquiflexum balticum DSM 16537]